MCPSVAQHFTVPINAAERPDGAPSLVLGYRFDLTTGSVTLMVAIILIEIGGSSDAERGAVAG